MAERWLPVVGYEGLYEVSDLGRVRRSDVEPARVISQWSGHGYLSADLWRDGKKKAYRVHRLVLTAFVGPCPAEHEGAHDDNDRARNVLSNLRWATRPENHRDKIRHGTRQVGERGGGSKLTEPQVRSILALRHKMSGAKLADTFGVCAGTISAILTGKTWPHVAR